MFPIFAAATIVLGCEEENETTDIDVPSIDGQWTMLTEIDGEWTIFNPCDAQNQGLSISKTDSLWSLVHQEGHEASLFHILSVRQIHDGVNLSLQPSWSIKDSAIAFIKLLDSNTVEVQWGGPNLGEKHRFCSDQTKGLFRVIDQPCVECWDEIDCDPNLKPREVNQYKVKLFNPDLERSYDTVVPISFIEDHQYLVDSYNYLSFEVRFETDTMLMLILGDQTIEFVKTKFKPEQHELTFLQDQPSALYGIDGREFYGTDMTIPRFEFKSILYERDTQMFFPAAQISDLYNPNLSATHVSAYESDRGEVILTMLNSDGAGTYFVTWIIHEGKVERYVQSDI